MSSDITRTRATCHECWRIAPSQPSTPPATPQVPSLPFQAVAADFFSLRGAGYLVIVDRFSGWPHIVASVSGAHGFCRALLSYFSTFGVPEELSTDGGPEFTARETAVLLGRWGVRHRLSSAYHPQSNGRAEVAVKFMKRLLLTHVNADGEFHTDAVAAGLLQYRNTPDPETGLSPAQVVFGRSVRDLLPITPEATIFESPTVHPVWRDTWACQEQAMRLRFARQTDVLGERSRPLPSLSPGATVLIQNQTGQHPKRWDRTGSVIEARAHDQYVVKVHGSGRVTLRNRRFLRPITGLLPFERPPPPPPSRLAQSPVPPPSPAPDDAAPATTGPAAPSSTSPRSGSAAPTPIGTDSAAPASPVPRPPWTLSPTDPPQWRSRPHDPPTGLGPRRVRTSSASTRIPATRHRPPRSSARLRTASAEVNGLGALPSTWTHTCDTDSPQRHLVLCVRFLIFFSQCALKLGGCRDTLIANMFPLCVSVSEPARSFVVNTFVSSRMPLWP